jgi:hypothetical protein
MISGEGINLSTKIGSILGCGSSTSEGSGEGQGEVDDGTGRSDEAISIVFSRDARSSVSSKSDSCSRVKSSKMVLEIDGRGEEGLGDEGIRLGGGKIGVKLIEEASQIIGICSRDVGATVGTSRGNVEGESWLQ